MSAQRTNPQSANRRAGTVTGVFFLLVSSFKYLVSRQCHHVAPQKHQICETNPFSIHAAIHPALPLKIRPGAIKNRVLQSQNRPHNAPRPADPYTPPMRLVRFHVQRLRAGRIALPPDEAHHARAVLRSRIGDRVELFDGRGAVGRGTVCAIERHSVEVEVEQVEQVEFDLRHRIVLAVAVGKAHRQSYLVEKCTELGVAGIWTIRSERSVTKPGEFAAEKWAKRAIESCKQCGRAWTPVIDGPFSIEQALARRGEFAAMALADPDEHAIPFDGFLRTLSAGSSILVWIGPEGGWTDAERSKAITGGATSVRLAPAILRTETAAVAACATAAMVSVSMMPSV